MRRFIALFLLSISCLQAEIIEVNEINQLKTYAKPGRLIIFDIDNTLMETAQFLGSDTWFHHRIGFHKQAGMNANDALEKALSEWMAVQNVTDVVLVEDEAEEIVRGLQENGYTVMGLTTRGLGLCMRTIEQLNRLSVDLSKTPPSHREIHFMNPIGVLFRKGILFTAGTHKGQALFKLLDQVDYQPKEIVFINDKASHLRQVEITCEQRGIPFIGLRYGYLDPKLKRYDDTIADVQFKRFGRILSNEEASKRLKRQK